MALPWMGLPADASYHAVDVDGRSLEMVDGFLDLVRQPHVVEPRDLVSDGPPPSRADVALLLKLVPLLDRQDRMAATRLLGALDVRHAVVTFPARSLGGLGRGMERTYRSRLDELVADLGVGEAHEASVPNELVFMLTLRG
jgi:ribosomal RNA methyltransferase FmrO